MAGNTAQSLIMADTARSLQRDNLVFRLANADDDADLRALLRRQALPGWVTLSFEREPNYFAAGAIEGERNGVLLARDASTGHLAGMYSRAARRVYVNGEQCWLGYVGQLRMDPQYTGGYRAYRRLSQGFDIGRDLLRREDELPFDITSILTDNRPARRILTAALPGMPRYHRVTGLTTLALPVRSRRFQLPAEYAVRQATQDDLVGISQFLQTVYRRYQCAPVWDEATLRSPVLTPELEPTDFFLVERHAEIVACAALWDQRRVKQSVVRGYRRPLGFLRPLINLAAGVSRVPRLPPSGEALSQAWLSHLAVDRDAEMTIPGLVQTILNAAAGRHIEQLLSGLADDNPILNHISQHFRHFTYRSELYTIQWPGAPAPNEIFDNGPVHVEIATL